MRFNLDNLQEQVGKERILVKFLLFPKRINKEIRWLETAAIRQRVIAVDVGGSMQWGKYKHRWVDVAFLHDSHVWG